MLEDMDVHVFIWLADAAIWLAGTVVWFSSSTVRFANTHQAKWSGRPFFIGVGWETIATNGSACGWPRTRVRSRARPESLFLWITGSGDVGRIAGHCTVS